MKPSIWRTYATAIILVYLYVLAVQEILGEEIIAEQRGNKKGQQYYTGEEQPTSSEDAADVAQYMRGHHKTMSAVGSVETEDSSGGQYTTRDRETGSSVQYNSRDDAEERSPQFRGSTHEADVPATRAVGYHPSYSLDPSYNGQSLHYSGTSNVYDDGYGLEFKYHNYEQLTSFLRTTSSRYPNLTALYSIGKSVQGKRTVRLGQCECNANKLSGS